MDLEEKHLKENSSHCLVDKAEAVHTAFQAVLGTQNIHHSYVDLEEATERAVPRAEDRHRLASHCSIHNQEADDGDGDVEGSRHRRRRYPYIHHHNRSHDPMDDGPLDYRAEDKVGNHAWQGDAAFLHHSIVRSRTWTAMQKGTVDARRGRPQWRTPSGDFFDDRRGRLHCWVVA